MQIVLLLLSLLTVASTRAPKRRDVKEHGTLNHEHGVDFFRPYYFSSDADSGGDAETRLSDMLSSRRCNSQQLTSMEVEDSPQTCKSQDEADMSDFWSEGADKETIRRKQAALMLSYMDRDADPCADFYQYACGRWPEVHPIPGDMNGFGTFDMLRESLDHVLKDILSEPADEKGQEDCDDNDDGEEDVDDTEDAVVKVRNMYLSCMDYEVLERRGAQPLLSLLDQLGGWPVLKPDWKRGDFDWLDLVGQLRLYNNRVFIETRVSPDTNDSDLYILQLDQTSLGLRTRDDFLLPANRLYLEAYKNYFIQVSSLLGASLETATVQANEVVEFETRLAQIVREPSAESHANNASTNAADNCQRLTVGELRRWIPQIDWQGYLSTVLGRPVACDERVMVFALSYFQQLVTLLADTEPRVIANYLLWRFVQHRVFNLDDRFVDANRRLDFILSGREQVPPRWKSCVSQVNNNMGMALGALFVRRYFDEYSKNDTTQMTEAIMHSFRRLLNQTEWIDDDTKRAAFLKVDAMTLKIGYPDFILDRRQLNELYDDVVIMPGLHFENTLNILRHRVRIEQKHMRTRVFNKTQWDTAPTVVNGYYSRNKNQVIFPACILQPPFYHRFFPKSLNFGGIGVVIGHEITHGFDDHGRLFDRHGNMHRWWSDASVENFHRRAKCLIDQYSHYEVKEVNMMVDGVNTQGENIADNGGLKQAFAAYRRWRDADATADDATDAEIDDEERLPGMKDTTPDQLFFLNFAQVWCSGTRREAARAFLKTGVHSPGKFRVIGTLSNSDEFARAYQCPVGSQMNPQTKCTVW